MKRKSKRLGKKVKEKGKRGCRTSSHKGENLHLHDTAGQSAELWAAGKGKRRNYGKGETTQKKAPRGGNCITEAASPPGVCSTSYHATWEGENPSEFFATLPGKTTSLCEATRPLPIEKNYSLGKCQKNKKEKGGKLMRNRIGEELKGKRNTGGGGKGR